MESPRRTEFPNKTAQFFHKICVLSFYCGLPNFWMHSLPFSKKKLVYNRKFSQIVTSMIYVFILTEIGAYFTQTNLTEKQNSNMMIFAISHTVLWSYTINFSSHATQVTELLTDILKLKEVYNDSEVEKQMMMKSKFYSSAFYTVCSISMIMYTFDGLMQVVTKEGTFTTVITVWPLLDDTSAAANVARLVGNILWWTLIARVLIVYTFVFSLVSCMSHQYLDLQSYFHSLDNIFSNENLSQTCKELEYETAYKAGIKLHTATLKCVEHSKIIFGWLFSGQIIFNIIMLVMLMGELLKAETLMHAAATLFASTTIISGTGLIMCNAGDVTHERPVVIRGLGIITLSYESYVSLVKSTYSVFSLVLQESNA